MGKVVKVSPACEDSVYDERRVIALKVRIYGSEGQYMAMNFEFDEFDWSYNTVREVLCDQFDWHREVRAHAFYGQDGQRMIMDGLRHRNVELEIYDKNDAFFNYIDEVVKDDGLDAAKRRVASKASLITAFDFGSNI